MTELVVRMTVGSQAYGVTLEDSDTDTLEVWFPTSEMLLGLAPKKKGDKSYYLHDVVAILMKGSINLLEALFIEPEQSSMWWTYLVDIRNTFIGYPLQKSVQGYINTHLNKIERLRRWYWATRESTAYFDVFPEEKKTYDKWLNVNWWSEEDKNRTLQKYKHGYDVKLAYHCLRLCYEMEELAETGKIQFPLKRANELMSIRLGEWGYNKFMDTMSGQVFDWGLDCDFDVEAIKNLLREIYMEGV